MPSYIIGKPPQGIAQQTQQVATEISKLGAFFTREKFNITITDFDEVSKFIKTANFNLNRHLGKKQVLRVCRALASQYVVRTEVDFQSHSFMTEIYNCGGYLVSQKEDLWQGDFSDDYRKHILTTANFLPPAPLEKIQQYMEKVAQITIVLDLSGSYIIEARQLQKIILRLVKKEKKDLKVLLVGSQKSQYLNTRKKILSALNNLSIGGEISPQQMANALFKIPDINSLSGHSHRKILIFTDLPLTRKNSHTYQNALQALKYSGYKITVYSNSFNHPQVNRLHASIASLSGNPLNQSISYRTIGTNTGFKTLFLHKNKLYYNQTGKVRAQDIRIDNLTILNPRKIQMLVDHLHPNNMVEIYRQITGEKILEQRRLYTNIGYLFQQALRKNTPRYGQKYKKVLVKSQGTSFWLRIQPGISIPKNQKLTFRSVFYQDKNNGLGIGNIAEKTSIAEKNIPQLIHFNIQQISQYLRTDHHNRLDCFVSGYVLEVK